MVFPFRNSRLIVRLSVVASVALAFASVSQPVFAQTAPPSLVPYTTRLIAGGGAAYAMNARCASGNMSADGFGDGCLATEVVLTSPRYAIVDKAGNVFFSDYTAGLIRRVDATTGKISTVAGQALAGLPCGGTSVDVKGDGCLANSVALQNPAGMAFAANGDLYITEAGTGNSDVRKIAADATGLITTTGIITLVAGNPAKSTGYAVNQGATLIVSGSTSSYLDFPTSVYFDKAGNLYIADEGNEALEVVNLNLTPQTVQGVTIPPGTIAKIAGYGQYQTSSTTGECPNGVFVSNKNRGGCYFGTYSTTSATPAVTALLDAPYALALDSSGSVYFDNEFIEGVGKISNGSLTNFAGNNASSANYDATTNPFPRAQAGTFPIGSNFGLDVDASNDVYISDALNGVIWRVDPSGAMYVIAGGAATVCSTVVDAWGDGCPALQSKFGMPTTKPKFTSSGVYGIATDSYYDLFVGDSVTNLVREIASGTNFGNTTARQTDNILVHFAAGDKPASSGAFTITSGSTIFTIGTTSFVVNSDNTTDYLVPITATPSVPGAYSGTLTVKSTAAPAGVAFPLSGIFIQSPVTRTQVAVAPPTGCTGTTYSTGASVTLTATLVANGPSAPTGTIAFFANGAQIGTPQNVVNLGTASAPQYGATLAYTFSTPNTYTITATYSGDGYFQTSTGTAPTMVTSSNPSITAAVTPYTEPSIVAGGTALYSFTVQQNVYTGTITFACTGLPAYATCVFSPTSLTANGCSTSGTVALSIYTQQATPILASVGGRWLPLTVLCGLGLTLMLGLRRRRFASRIGAMGMMLALLITAAGVSGCGNGTKTILSTPPGTYTITVTATGSAGAGSAGTVSSFPVTLKVN